MTSTEFAAKYRLLKNVATRGARSFLAQQTELGRMVMVHYLDAEPAAERGDAVARLQRLTRPARDKLLEIVDVDGFPVAVTLFISSFVDFSTWLDQVAGPVPPEPERPAADEVAAEVTAPRAAILRAPEPESAPRSERPLPAMPSAEPGHGDPSLSSFAPKSAPRGEFTQLFGKLSFPADTGAFGAPPAQSNVSPPPTPDYPADSPTLIMDAVKAAPEAMKPAPADVPQQPVAPMTPPPSNPQPEMTRREEVREASFTAIFGAAASSVPSTPLPPASSLPSFGAAPGAGHVMPFGAPEPQRPVQPPVEAPSAAPPAGEFTQLFQRLNVTAAPPSPTKASEVGRPLETMRAADMSSAPPAPRFGTQAAPDDKPAQVPPVSLNSGAMLPPLSAANAPINSDLSRPPGAAWGAPTLPSDSAPSDFTRILGRVSPPGQPMSTAAPTPAAPSAQPASSPAPTGEPRVAKSYLPLILALNAVVVATITIVLYFVLKK